MSKIDKNGSENGKHAGMSRAAKHANPEWWAYTYNLIREVARRQPFLFSDDIEALRRRRGGPGTHENRALGPLMKEARRNGICVPTNKWVPSSQVLNHRRPMRVWKSCLYTE